MSRYPQYWERMGPTASAQTVSELCGTIISWGHGDDEKRLCSERLSSDIAHYSTRPPMYTTPVGPVFRDTFACLILSLGCNGQWNFERLAAKHTPCDIHTFDCTGSWQVPESLRSRVSIHKLCLGLPTMIASSPQKFTNYDGLLNLTGRRTPVIMKADIEGFEYNLLAEIVSSTRGPAGASSLPRQLGIELHKGLVAAKFRTKTPSASAFDQLMASVRQHFQLVHRRYNAPKAIEVLWVSKEK